MSTGLDLAIAHEDLVTNFRVLVIEVVDELTPLLWQHEGRRNEIEILLGILVLHTPHVQAESVLAGELGARREVVYFLM